MPLYLTINLNNYLKTSSRVDFVIEQLVLVIQWDVELQSLFNYYKNFTHVVNITFIVWKLQLFILFHFLFYFCLPASRQMTHTRTGSLFLVFPSISSFVL